MAKRALLALAVVGLMASDVLAPAVVVSAQESAQEAREQREQARKEAAAAAASLDAAKAEDADVAEALAAITALVDAQNLEVVEARRLLAVNEIELSLAQTEVVAGAADQITLEERLAGSAVSGFVSAQDSSGTWLESEDLSRSIRQQALLDEVNDDTAELLEALAAAREDQELAQARADDALVVSQELESELATVLSDLQGQQAVQAELKAEMEARVASWRTELANAQADEDRLSDFIRAEEIKAAAPAPAPVPSAGTPSSQGFQWPISAPITSNFGYRVHPIYGTRRLHAGIDFGAASGSAIVAANGGTVISAGWQSGYGNTVVVSHGNGLTTLYAHQSSIAVSRGQSVGRGEVIGYVGSTGNSTGPHLHFEIRSNGTPVNPRPYLP